MHSQNQKIFRPFPFKKSERQFPYIISVIATLLCAGLILSALSYVLYYRTLTRTVASYSEEVVNRTDVIVTETFRQIENFATQQALSAARIINSKATVIADDYYRLNQIYSNLLNLKNSNSFIHSTYVYFNQGRLIVSSSTGIVPVKLFYDTEWIDIYRRHSSEATWTEVRYPSDDNHMDSLRRYGVENTEIITLLVPLSSSLKGQGGVVVINVYVDMLKTLINSSRRPGASLTSLLTEDGNILISGISSENSEDLLLRASSNIELSPKNKTGYFSLADDEKNEYLCTYQVSDFNNYLILELVPITAFQEARQSLLFGTIITYALLITIFLLSFLWINRLSRKPVKELYQAIGDQIQASSNYSISEINRIIQKTFQERDDLSKLWNDNKRIIRHRTLSLLLKGNLSTLNNLSAVDIVFPYEYYLCCCFHMDLDENVIQPDTASQYEVLKMQFFSIIKETLPVFCVGYTVDTEVLEITLILNKNDQNIQPIMDYCEQVSSLLREKIHPYTISVGVGSMFKDITNINISYRHAVTTMRYAIAHYKGHILNYIDISLDSGGSPYTESLDNNLLKEALMAGELNTTKALLNNWLDAISAAESDSNSFHVRFMSEIQNLSNLFYDLGIRNDSDLHQLIEIASENETLDEYKQFFIELCELAAEKLDSKRNGKNAKIMKKVINYIEEHYSDDISLVDAANTVYLSAPYLSKLFKDYTGKTFIDHLTFVRIEHSKNRLLQSSEKIKDIATSVGYANAQSFIRAFKKVTGMTPKAYRDNAQFY